MNDQSIWVYSPDPALEELIHAVYTQFPPLRPQGLDHLQRLHMGLYRALGSPVRRMPFVFHVAGTNGKGSTLAFLQAIFETAGLKVHKYTSPHLVQFEERIVVASRQVTPAQLIPAVQKVLSTIAEEKMSTQISFFEIFTLAAFILFAQEKADVVLLETGLGGRLDATNIVETSLSILTRISFDHMRLLGDTLPAIAAEKAGIIKPHSTAILAAQSDQSVNDVFIAAAQKQQAKLFKYSTDWRCDMTDQGFSYHGKNNFDHLPFPALPGAHQIMNAATAIAALEQSPFAQIATPELISTAMTRVTWPGRLQKILSQDGVEIWLDGAHNDSGAEVLKPVITAWNKERPVYLLTSFKDKKDSSGFYQPLMGLFDRTIVTNLRHAPFMVPAAELAKFLLHLGYSDVAVTSRPSQGLEQLRAEAQKNKARIVVTGSLYLVGAILREYKTWKN